MLLWMDGFDTYGTDTAKMKDGLYAQVESSTTLVTAPVRTGTHAIRMSGSSFGVWRRVLPAITSSAGFGAGYYPEALPPSGNSPLVLIQFCDGSNNPIVTVQVTTTGTIRVYRGNTKTDTGGPASTLLGESAIAITAGAYQHVETFCKIGVTNGEVAIRVNNVLVLNLVNVDTGSTDIAQLRIDREVYGHPAPPVCYLDDIYAYNAAGTINNTIGVGDCRVYTLRPNGDTVEADWTKSVGTVGYSLIDDAAPDDTDYITAPAAGNMSEFELENLPPEVGTIKGVMVQARQHKSDAGISQVQNAIVSGVAATNGVDRAITTVPTFYTDVVEQDPATLGQWTRTAVNAARIRNTRTV